MNKNPPNNKRNIVLTAIITAGVSVLITLVVLNETGRLAGPEENRQESVHEMGSNVMPFDLGETTHIFEMTESGGIQQVIADDPNDKSQIELIQMHLQHEALRFAAGDFSDPTSLHGGDMPGVKELAAGVGDVKIEYVPLDDGGQITFTAQDIPLITAIHRWFGAQLSDHGADATYR